MPIMHEIALPSHKFCCWWCFHFFLLIFYSPLTISLISKWTILQEYSMKLCTKSGRMFRTSEFIDHIKWTVIFDCSVKYTCTYDHFIRAPPYLRFMTSRYDISIESSCKIMSDPSLLLAVEARIFSNQWKANRSEWVKKMKIKVKKK